MGISIGEECVECYHFYGKEMCVYVHRRQEAHSQSREQRRPGSRGTGSDGGDRTHIPSSFLDLLGFIYSKRCSYFKRKKRRRVEEKGRGHEEKRSRRVRTHGLLTFQH